jgi:hypothetical protein
MITQPKVCMHSPRGGQASIAEGFEEPEIGMCWVADDTVEFGIEIAEIAGIVGIAERAEESRGRRGQHK